MAHGGPDYSISTIIGTPYLNVNNEGNGFIPRSDAAYSVNVQCGSNLNRIVIAFFCIGNAGYSTITANPLVGGQPMVALLDSGNLNPVGQRMRLYYYLNPAQGLVSCTGGVVSISQGYNTGDTLFSSFSGVHQQFPVRTPVLAHGTSGTGAVSTSDAKPGDLVIACVNHDEDNVFTQAWLTSIGPNQFETIRGDTSLIGGTQTQANETSVKVATVAAEQMSAVFLASRDWVYSGVPLRPASSSS